MISTYFSLMAEFQTTHVELEKVAAKYFAMSSAKALEKARAGEFPIPAFRAGSQKSPWLVDVRDLAEYLDRCRAAALEAAS